MIAKFQVCCCIPWLNVLFWRRALLWVGLSQGSSSIITDHIFRLTLHESLFFFGSRRGCLLWVAPRECSVFVVLDQTSLFLPPTFVNWNTHLIQPMCSVLVSDGKFIEIASSQLWWPFKMLDYWYFYWLNRTVASQLKMSVFPVYHHWWRASWVEIQVTPGLA